MATTITPPPGFELESRNQASRIPELPPGFQVENEIRDKQQPSVSADIAESAVTGIRKGIGANIPGLPGDLYSLLSAAAEWGATKISDATGLPKGGTLAKKIGQILPTSDDFVKFYESKGSTYHKPETVPGKYALSVTEGAASNLLPGAGAANKAMAVMGAAGGAGGELASQLTEGNPLGRIAGTIIGTAAVGTPRALVKNAGTMVRESTEGLTPAQIEAAIRAQQAGKSVGIDLMGPESLPVGSVQQLAADTMASRSGGKVMGSFLEKRPEQIRKAVDKELLAKTAKSEPPVDTLTRAQKTATKVISTEEKSRTAAVNPYYKSASKDIVPNKEIDRLTSKAASLSRQLEHIPEVHKQILDFNEQVLLARGNVGKLDDVYKFWRDKIDTPAINASSAEKFAAKKLGELVSDLDKTLKKSSGELTTGRDLYRQISEEVIDPLIQGDIGKIAGKGYDPQVMPPIQRIVSVIADEKMSRPLTIRNVYTRLNKEDKEAFPKVVRLHLENAFDEASKDVQSGVNRMLGANFKKSVYGTPQQRSNFLEMMAGVAEANGVNKSDLQRGAVTLLDTLERTGKIPNIGSPTGSRLESNVAARRSRVAGALETVSTQPLNPISKTLRDIVHRKAYKNLAEVFTAPDSVQKMIELSKLTPSSNKAQLLVSEIIGTRLAYEKSSESGDGEE